MLVNIRGSLQYNSLKFGSSSITTMSFPVDLDGAMHLFGDMFLALPAAARFIKPQEKESISECVGSFSRTAAKENDEHIPGCCVCCSVAG
jgi:hypothetical protein